MSAWWNKQQVYKSRMWLSSSSQSFTPCHLPVLLVCLPRRSYGKISTRVHWNPVCQEVLMDDGCPHDTNTSDQEEAGGTIEVVHPASHGLLPCWDHNTWPHDADRQLAALRHDDLLGNGLGEGVGVGPVADDLPGDDGWVQHLPVHAVQQSHCVLGFHRGFVGFLLNMVWFRYMDTCHTCITWICCCWQWQYAVDTWTRDTSLVILLHSSTKEKTAPMFILMALLRSSSNLTVAAQWKTISTYQITNITCLYGK